MSDVPDGCRSTSARISARSGHRAAVHRDDDVERRQTAAGRTARPGLAVFHQSEARRDATHAQPAIAEGDHRDERDDADERPAEHPLATTSPPTVHDGLTPTRREGRRQTHVEIPVDAVALAIPGGRRGRGLVQHRAGLRTAPALPAPEPGRDAGHPRHAVRAAEVGPGRMRHRAAEHVGDDLAPEGAPRAPVHDAHARDPVPARLQHLDVMAKSVGHPLEQGPVQMTPAMRRA